MLKVVAVCMCVAAAGATTEDPTWQRRVNAIVAAFVADAAAMPLHWIYDTDVLAGILREANATAAPEFLSPSHAPFYDYPVARGVPHAQPRSPRRGDDPTTSITIFRVRRSRDENHTTHSPTDAESARRFYFGRGETPPRPPSLP